MYLVFNCLVLFLWKLVSTRLYICGLLFCCPRVLFVYFLLAFRLNNGRRYVNRLQRQYCLAKTWNKTKKWQKVWRFPSNGIKFSRIERRAQERLQSPHTHPEKSMWLKTVFFLMSSSSIAYCVMFFSDDSNCFGKPRCCSYGSNR